MSPKILFFILASIAVILGIMLYRILTPAQEEYKEKRVCIYAGEGAVLAGDVEKALKKLGIPYYKVDENFIKSGKLLNYCTVLIVPGGYTAKYVSALGKDGFEKIREFIAKGGGYIGICAGAYIAAKTVEVQGRPEGLGIINITNIRVSGHGLVNITIVNPDHPIAKNLPAKIEIWYQNGPHMKPGEGVEVIAVYDDGTAAIVAAKYGNGTVVIFSPHPEGSTWGNIDPEKVGTLKLLENAINYTLNRC